MYVKPKRYAISVSGKTYARLRSAELSVSMQQFINVILESALADPAILERLVAQCQLDEQRG
jgi:hypothetical protein